MLQQKKTGVCAAPRLQSGALPLKYESTTSASHVARQLSLQRLGPGSSGAPQSCLFPPEHTPQSALSSDDSDNIPMDVEVAIVIDEAEPDEPLQPQGGDSPMMQVIQMRVHAI